MSAAGSGELGIDGGVLVDGRGPGGASADSQLKARARWRPGVRVVLLLMGLLPMLSTALLTGSRLSSGWTFRQQAERVAGNADLLQAVAAARATMNTLFVPLTTVAYAAGVGVSPTVLDSVFKPTVPFTEQLAQVAVAFTTFPDFSSPTLRSDLDKLHAVSLEFAANTVVSADVNALMRAMTRDIDNLWFSTFDLVQADVRAGRSAGSFGAQVSTVLQTYQAFRSGARTVKGVGVVLQGLGGADARQVLIQAAGEYAIATSLFEDKLTPRAQVAWDAMQSNTANQQFAATIQQAMRVALDNTPSPYAGDPAAAAAATVPGFLYLADLNALVVIASQDLHDSALTEAADATRQFAIEAALLVLLGLVGVAAVIVAGRLLIRPLERLATTAQEVHDGYFDVEPIPDRGPRELVGATRAFNDMASTLQAVESTAVALATEDFLNPELSIPLPARTGHALQATIDSLASRIREREEQRELLHEAATHDQLTGLLNRAAVIDYLTHDVARRRQAGETAAVLFMDLDGLKQLNDTYGHAVGDAAVVATAKAILDATDLCDVVGRLGGDEFLVVLCHQHSGDGEKVADRVNASLGRRSFAMHDISAPLRASVGIAFAACDADTDPMTLVRDADAAMYKAKRAARAARDVSNQSPANTAT